MGKSEAHDPVGQLAHFIVEQFVGSLDDFVRNKTDKLLHLTKEPEKASKERLLVLLKDNATKATKDNKNENSCNNAESGKSPLFFYLLETYSWKDDIKDELGGEGFKNLKKFLKEEHGINQPRKLIARRIKTRDEYAWLNDNSNDTLTNQEKQDQLEKLAKKIIFQWGRISFGGQKKKSDVNYYERVRIEERENDSEIIASRSKFYAHTRPEIRFIYDSRVAMALFLLTLLSNQKKTFFFPLVAGRSNAYQQIKELFKDEYELSLKQEEPFYVDKYCDLIQKVSANLTQKFKIQDKLTEEEQKIFGQLVEMALFSLGRKIKGAGKR